MFVVIAEGTVTEREYFSIFDNHSLIRVKCLENRTNLPPEAALKRVTRYLSEEGLRSSDEIWIVVDRDSWSEEALNALYEWSTLKKNYGFALSNPKFESWLLLHFEDAKGRALSHDCDTRLKIHHPNYDKHLNTRLFTASRIRDAITRAIKHDTPACTDWPRRPGSTVYRLVQKLTNDSPK